VRPETVIMSELRTCSVGMGWIGRAARSNREVGVVHRGRCSRSALRPPWAELGYPDGS
jgi:hypothetical protein